MKTNLSKSLQTFVLLICMMMQTKVDAFSSFSSVRYWSSLSGMNPIRRTIVANNHFPDGLCPHSTPVDDDDISQHETMMAGSSSNTADEDDSTSSTTQDKKGGYRRIEDWHEETV